MKKIKEEKVMDIDKDSTFVETPDSFMCVIDCPENIDMEPDEYMDLVVHDSVEFTSDNFGKDIKDMDTAFQNYMNYSIAEINGILENIAMNLKHYQDVKNVRTGNHIAKIMAKKVD